jgi:hypothetical protein
LLAKTTSSSTSRIRASSSENLTAGYSVTFQLFETEREPLRSWRALSKQKTKKDPHGPSSGIFQKARVCDYFTAKSL